MNYNIYQSVRCIFNRIRIKGAFKKHVPTRGVVASQKRTILLNFAYKRPTYADEWDGGVVENGQNFKDILYGKNIK